MSEVRVARARMARAIDEARCERRHDPEGARRRIEAPAIDLAKAIARCRCRELVSNADLDQLTSMASEAVWTSLPRLDFSLDTPQIVRFLSDRANHAVSDAAREADPLPRRSRTYRNKVLAAAARAGAELDEETIRQFAQVMYPQVTPRTMDLIVRGAPPLMELTRADAEAMLPPMGDDPAGEVIGEATVDAVHVTIADQPDPSFRAWAARVLGGELDGRTVPGCFAKAAEAARAQLADWT